MNLLEHQILEIVNVQDVTDSWVDYMRKNGHPDFEADEPMLKVFCRETCYGSESMCKHTWRKSELEKYKAQGFYMG